MATNRLKWEVEPTDYGTFAIVTASGSPVLLNGSYKTYPTQEAAEQAISAEVAKRDRRNAASRGRGALLRSLGLKRNLDGSWE